MNKGDLSYLQVLNHNYKNMKEFILSVDKRRPLKFTGVILAATWAKESFASSEDGSDHPLEILEKGLLPDLDLRRRTLSRGDGPPEMSVTWLTLFKTQSGKFIILEERMSLGYDVTNYFNTLSQSCSEIYSSFKKCVEAQAKEDGKFGLLTSQLFNLAIEAHLDDSELLDAWVESID